MPAARKRASREDADPTECPVCFEAFEGRGARAKVRSFLCKDGVAHAICSACDRTLYVRGEEGDRCPICRAGRAGSSIQRNGPRPLVLPPPMHRADGGGGMGHHSIGDFLSWLPRRIGGTAAASGGLSVASGTYGGRAFYPDESELATPQSPPGHHSFMNNFRAAAAGRRARSNVTMFHSPVSGLPILRTPIDPIDLTEDGNLDDLDVTIPPGLQPTDAAHDAALAFMLEDEGVNAALYGLRHVSEVGMVEFSRRLALAQAIATEAR